MLYVLCLASGFLLAEVFVLRCVAKHYIGAVAVPGIVGADIDGAGVEFDVVEYAVRLVWGLPVGLFPLQVRFLLLWVLLFGACTACTATVVAGKWFRYHCCHSCCCGCECCEPVGVRSIVVPGIVVIGVFPIFLLLLVVV